MNKRKFKFDENKRDVPGDKANGQRAEQAEYATAAANRTRGESDRLDEDAVRDLLADLGHLCDREGYDYKSLLDLAWDDWRAER